MTDEEVRAAKQRVEERRRIRAEAKDRSIEIPDSDRRRLSQEFHEAARQAARITQLNRSGFISSQ